jgi:hypothetical protein
VSDVVTQAERLARLETNFSNLTDRLDKREVSDAQIHERLTQLLERGDSRLEAERKAWTQALEAERAERMMLRSTVDRWGGALAVVIVTATIIGPVVVTAISRAIVP